MKHILRLVNCCKILLLQHNQHLYLDVSICIFSCHVASLSWQEPEEELNKLLLMKVSDRDRSVKVRMLVVLRCRSGGVLGERLARAYSGVLEAEPPSGARRKAPGQGVRRCAPEAGGILISDVKNKTETEKINSN